MAILRRGKVLPLGTITVVGLGVAYFLRQHRIKQPKPLLVREAVIQSKAILQKLKESSGSPGLAVAVSLNGNIVWQQGFGYADIENNVPCSPHSVMKIASISKPITSVVLAKLWEMGLVDLDVDIVNYINDWPEKYWNGEKVPLTLKQLATHRAGIRDYRPIRKEIKDSSDDLEFDYEEYYITKTYKTVEESLSIFKDDPLIAKPGEEFHYTTHGYTLLSACLEAATGKDFPVLAYNLYKDLDMNETYLDNDKQKLIYDRSCHYVKGSDGVVRNAPYTESSFKLAGAGMLSTVLDLIKFGHIVLYSYQRNSESSQLKPGYLKASTVKMLWQPLRGSVVSWHPQGGYGMGWQCVPYDERGDFEFVPPAGDKGEASRFLVGHTGGTVGASSALVILPSRVRNVDTQHLPCGVVVAILVNLQGVSLGKIATQIAKIFDNCSLH